MGSCFLLRRRDPLLFFRILRINFLRLKHLLKSTWKISLLKGPSIRYHVSWREGKQITKKNSTGVQVRHSHLFQLNAETFRKARGNGAKGLPGVQLCWCCDRWGMTETGCWERKRFGIPEERTPPLEVRCVLFSLFYFSFFSRGPSITHSLPLSRTRQYASIPWFPEPVLGATRRLIFLS